jgi:hypothetical protein
VRPATSIDHELLREAEELRDHACQAADAMLVESWAAQDLQEQLQAELAATQAALARAALERDAAIAERDAARQSTPLPPPPPAAPQVLPPVHPPALPSVPLPPPAAPPVHTPTDPDETTDGEATDDEAAKPIPPAAAQLPLMVPERYSNLGF